MGKYFKERFKFKKALSVMALLLMTVMLLHSNVSAKSIESISEENYSVVSTNEYTLLKEAEKNKELTRNGLNANCNVDELFKEELTKRSKLSDESLKKLGYSSSEISGLRNFKGTPREMAAYSGGVDVGVYISNGGSSNGRKTAKINFSWNWNKMPIVKTTDIIGLGWTAKADNDLELKAQLKGGICNINYYNANGGGYLYTRQSAIIEDDGFCNASFKIPMYTNQGINPFAKSGNGYWTVQTDRTPINRIAAVVKYGHNTLTITPSISISSNPLGFSFNTTTLISGTQSATLKF
ncbi:Uncharacterised protein [Clostridium tetani]|uniref:hypothetical protein n=1 Tax=Clostridium tetani TaxID=1513 RepID=UPI000D214853|nr:hypothetical protein [Clostridium tetani]AVP54516.1 hypothetical protein C3B72_05000 [Clostridium tetani]RXI75217.1 hypothetical protein DP128_11705 [Clostridium tetani]WFN62912.1 hypothetical protein PAA20_05545 [Clostridium tetani]SUY55119.1 Uncharacterised protein [Clostridium tetani]BDR83516.1 hypothetical protein K254310026_09270 [Clostridium tetani]